MLALSSAVRRDPIFDKSYFDRLLAAGHAKLIDAEFTFARDMVFKMSLAEAIAYTLKELDG